MYILEFQSLLNLVKTGLFVLVCMSEVLDRYRNQVLQHFQGKISL